MAEEVDPKVIAELNKLTDRWFRAMTHDFFHGPDTIRTREFMKWMKGEEMISSEDLKKELAEFGKEHKEILFGVSESGCDKSFGGSIDGL